MSKHTQDKWAVNSASRMEVNSFNGISIADCSMSQMINTEEKSANAKLIAAAPDLLEALKDIIVISDRNHIVWDKAKAAIKKAEGQP